MFKNIKAIFFDLDNTLFDFKECERQALEFLFENIGEKYKKEYQEIFSTIDKDLWNRVALNISEVPIEQIPEYRFKIFFDKISIKYIDYKRANKIFTEKLKQSCTLVENAEEVIKYLYNKNYKLYIVTNGLINIQKIRIMNSNISTYFSDIIVSEEVGVTKPNSKIFNELLKRNKLQPSEVIMIGDSLEHDIKGAKSVGIKSIWYNPMRLKNDTEIAPDYEIKDLLELKSILKSEVILWEK